tara:strand:- start:438 stop:725 length:288 start_codon:yes stop_codon:yes gene_type:complete
MDYFQLRPFESVCREVAVAILSRIKTIHSFALAQIDDDITRLLKSDYGTSLYVLYVFNFAAIHLLYLMGLEMVQPPLNIDIPRVSVGLVVILFMI